jgi:hypothetical protein
MICLVANRASFLFWSTDVLCQLNPQDFGNRQEIHLHLAKKGSMDGSVHFVFASMRSSSSLATLHNVEYLRRSAGG